MLLQEGAASSSGISAVWSAAEGADTVGVLGIGRTVGREGLNVKGWHGTCCLQQAGISLLAQDLDWFSLGKPCVVR
jgi:hypothetical protein